MKQTDTVSPAMAAGAAFVAVLSPLIRRFPRALAAAGGRSGWLAPLLAVLPLAAWTGLVLMRRRKYPGAADFGTLLTVGFGDLPGRILTGLYGLWLIAYGGFILRSGADRFISTVYFSARPGVFVLVMAAACTLAAAGDLKSVLRAAMLLRPFLVGVLLLIFLLTAKDLDPGLLLPLRGADFPGVLTGAAEIANLLAVSFCLAFGGLSFTRPAKTRDWLLPGAELLALLLWMTVSCLAMFGPELTAKMRFPFFMLVRDLSVLGSLERLEPVVVAVWVFSDFILLSLLLCIGARCLRFCCSRTAPPRRGGVPALLCGAAAAGIALAIPGDMTEFEWLSEILVPRLSAGFHVGLPLLTALVLAVRRRL